MEFPNNPETRITEYIMAKISDKIIKDPDKRVSNYNRVYELICNTLSHYEIKLKVN